MRRMRGFGTLYNPPDSGSTDGMIVPKGINFLSGEETAVLQYG